MFLLSRLVRRAGYKVVLTGEGADEFLAGYDIFKEAKIRHFCAEYPQSRWRPLLFRRLYNDIPQLAKTGDSYLAAFFGDKCEATQAFDYSHARRWRNGRRNWHFFTDEIRAQLAPSEINLGPASPSAEGLRDWEPLARAQYLEITTFLSQYLLSSQGDRVAMAHSVEGRYPFLDVRVVEYCNGLPANLKLHALTEKYLLRRVARKWLPEEIWTRRKRPYRAPIHRSFFHQGGPEYVRELLSANTLAQTGIFKPSAVALLMRKLQQFGDLGESDQMALVGILSTQILHHRFVAHFERASPVESSERVKVVHGSGVPCALGPRET
jgi:asparagine synthase (glutamine-hydrolysing)